MKMSPIVVVHLAVHLRFEADVVAVAVALVALVRERVRAAATDGGAQMIQQAAVQSRGQSRWELNRMRQRA